MQSDALQFLPNVPTVPIVMPSVTAISDITCDSKCDIMCDSICDTICDIMCDNASDNILEFDKILRS